MHNAQKKNRIVFGGVESHHFKRLHKDTESRKETETLLYLSIFSSFVSKTKKNDVCSSTKRREKTHINKLPTIDIIAVPK